MQVLTIAGTIGKDAELRTAGSDNVAGFNVAVDNGKDKSGNRRDSTWYECSLWGKRADALASYLRKGGRVTVTGRPTARIYNDKVYMGINVDNLTLQGGARESGGQSQSNQSADYSRDSGASDTGGATNYDLDDDIPW